MDKSSIGVSLLLNKFLPASSYSDRLVCICTKTKDKIICHGTDSISFFYDVTEQKVSLVKKKQVLNL